jgi:hypothetical protein
LGGYTFDKGNARHRSAGVIAQEVRAVLPEAVFEDESGTLSVDALALCGYLVEAVKELKAEVRNGMG